MSLSVVPRIVGGMKGFLIENEKIRTVLMPDIVICHRIIVYACAFLHLPAIDPLLIDGDGSVVP